MSGIALKFTLRNECLLSLGAALENLKDGQEWGRGYAKKTKAGTLDAPFTTVGGGGPFLQL